MSNSPSFKSEQYTKHEKQITLVRDMHNGTDSAVNHLRQFPKEESAEFNDRKQDTALDNYVETTASTTKNIIFRKPIDLSGITSKLVLEWSKNINFTDSLNKFAKDLLVNRMIDGNTYLLVDRMAFDEDQTKNAAQQSEDEKRPYFINVLRENVLNVEMDMYGNYTRVSIREFYSEKVGTFGSKSLEQIKVWYNDGKIEIWREDKLFDTIATKLKVIPLIKIGSDENPPLYNQAKLNIQHMNRGSECSNYVRVGASPFLAVFGNLEGGDKPKTLGINSGLKFSDKDQSDVKWIEMTGANYTIIKQEIEKLAEQMIRIAVSFATDSANKTATQVEKESVDGESKLTDYSVEIEEGINKGLEYMQLFVEASLGENTISTNKDFDSAILTPEQVTNYLALYTQNVISLDKLLEVLMQGEYIEQMTDKEIEKEKLLLRDSGVV